MYSDLIIPDISELKNAKDNLESVFTGTYLHHKKVSKKINV